MHTSSYGCFVEFFKTVFARCKRRQNNGCSAGFVIKTCHEISGLNCDGIIGLPSNLRRNVKKTVVLSSDPVVLLEIGGLSSNL